MPGWRLKPTLMPEIVALYHFASVNDPPQLRLALHDVATAAALRGTLLIAAEGVNGTLAGTAEGVETLVQRIRSEPGFEGLVCKYAQADEMPFGKLKVRLKREIVTMGQPDLDPTQAGTYVAPADWNALIAAPDVAVIDTRNSYEVSIGRFNDAIDPKTESFRDFPAWWEANKGKFEGKRIAMYCTGGIRCEKSTAYLRSQGVEQVYHLEGGILKYLETVPEAESQWDGACFVFDERVSVGHGLVEGPHELCRACRRPLAPEDLARPEFEEGVQCAACVDEHSDEDRARFRERQRQIALAKARGETHLGF